MNYPDPVQALKALIVAKEAEHAIQETIVREQLLVTYNSLKPLNLIKSAIQQAVSSDELQGSAGNVVMGKLSGLLIKKLIQFGSSNPLVKMSSTIVEMVVAAKVTENAEDIKAIGAIVLKKIMNHKRETQ